MWCNTHRSRQDWCCSFTALQQHWSPGLCVVKTVLYSAAVTYEVFVRRASLLSLCEGRRCADGCVREPSARSLIYITLHHGSRRREQLCLTHKLSHTDDNSPPQFSELWPISLFFCIYFTPRCFLLLFILVIISFSVHIFAPSYCVRMYVFIYLCMCVCVRRADSEDCNRVFGDSDTSTFFIHTNSFLRTATLFLLFINQIIGAPTATESLEISASFAIVISRAGKVAI